MPRNSLNIHNSINKVGDKLHQIQIDDLMPQNLHIGFGIQSFTQDRLEVQKTLKSRYGRLVLLRQKHSNKIVIARGQRTKGDFEIRMGDALITDKENVVLTIHTADCLPVLFFAEGKAIGAVHAGWRGTVQSILGQAISESIRLYKLSITEIKFIFMPAILDCCYEVGPEVGVLFDKKCHNKSGKMSIDVADENRKQLLKMGVSEKNIIRFDNCTFCDASFDWPSFRKDGKIKRRIINYITMIGKGENNA